MGVEMVIHLLVQIRGLRHSDFVLKIAGCRKIVDLSLPLALNLPSSYYRPCIARFPDLVTLKIYGEINEQRQGQ